MYEDITKEIKKELLSDEEENGERIAEEEGLDWNEEEELINDHMVKKFEEDVKVDEILIGDLFEEQFFLQYLKVKWRQDEALSKPLKEYLQPLPTDCTDILEFLPSTRAPVIFDYNHTSGVKMRGGRTMGF